MYNTLKSLIENKIYEKDAVIRRLNIYLLANKITQKQYEELNNLLKKAV